MINPNYKNVTENLVYIIITNILTAVIVFNASTKSNLKAIESFSPTIQKAIDKETIKNEILNEIDVKVDKIKKSDSIQININQKPYNEQKPENILISADSCCYKSIEYKKIYDIYKGLSESRKSRFKRWVN